MPNGDDEPIQNPWAYRQDDFLKGGGDANAMLELLRGDSPSLGVNTDLSYGSPSMGTPGNYDLGKQNLTANRLLYSPEMTAMFTPGVSDKNLDVAAALQAVRQGDATVGPSQAKIDAAKRVFFSDDFGVDQATKSTLTGDAMPTTQEDQRRLAPLTQTLRDQAKKVLDKDVWSSLDPQMMAAVGYSGTDASTGATGQTDQLIDQWKRDNNLKLGQSYEALQQLGIEFPGTGKTAPVFQPDAPARAIGRATLVAPTTAAPVNPNAPQDKTGLTSVIGSEFGEVDNPARGGYTEAGWNVGKWGHPISGKDTKLIALPPAQLKAYGRVDDPSFADNFNKNYEVQIVNPKTGVAASADLGDIGPGASTGAGIDLTWGVRQQLGLEPNFKGPVQYRIVKRGSALPDGTTSTVATTTDSTAPTAGGPAKPAVTYIQPLDPRTLRNPAIYGDRNTDEDNLKWARHQTDLYATEMAHAGAPIDTDEYKSHFDTFFKASQDQAKGVAPTQLPSADLDRFTTLTQSLTQLDGLLAAKQKAGGNGMLIPNDDVADYKAKRDILVGQIAKGLGGNVGSLSDTDVKRAQSMLPTEWDSPEEAQKKIDYTKSLTQQQMESMIRLRKAGNFDTHGLESEYFKAFPALNQAKQNQANTAAAARIEKQNVVQSPPQPPPPEAQPQPSRAPGLPSATKPTVSTDQPWWKKLGIF